MLETRELRKSTYLKRNLSQRRHKVNVPEVRESKKPNPCEDKYIMTKA